MRKTHFVAAMLLVVGSFAQSSSAAERECQCLKNIDGVCMTLGKGIPYWGPHVDYSDGGHFGPHCVTGCYPGFVNVYGIDKTTLEEIKNCHIDWQRLRREKESAEKGALQ